MKSIHMLCILALCLTAGLPEAVATDPLPQGEAETRVIIGDCVEIDGTTMPPSITVDPTC